jgi:hypothetical protein
MHKHIELQHDAFFYQLFELTSKFCVCSFYDANEAHKVEEISPYPLFTKLSITPYVKLKESLTKRVFAFQKRRKQWL